MGTSSPPFPAPVLPPLCIVDHEHALAAALGEVVVVPTRGPRPATEDPSVKYVAAPGQTAMPPERDRHPDRTVGAPPAGFSPTGTRDTQLLNQWRWQRGVVDGAAVGPVS